MLTQILQRKEFKFLLSEKELRELSDNSPNIFKGSNIDCYMERLSATFCNGKYGVLDNICFAEVLVNYST